MAIEIYDEIVIGDQVHFRARKDGRSHRFAVSREAIDDLAEYRAEEASEDLRRLEVFEEHQEQIARVAERIINLQLEGDAVNIISSDLLFP